MQMDDMEYTGFWARTGASIIDSILVAVIIFPLLTAYYGKSYWTSESLIQGPVDFLLSWVLPAVAVVIFWVTRQATPGKMAIAARVVDAKTGNNPTTTQCIVRYLGYFISMLPLFLGLIWVAFDGRKQGWHDKIAGTVVIRKKNRNSQPVAFNSN